MLFPWLLVLLGISFVSGKLDRIKVDGDNHWFYDTEGRVVIFHGVNSVYKAFPWYADNLFNDSRLDDLVDFGLNIMRLGSMWAGAEPAEGQFNETYIDILGELVERLETRGVYTLLDMHQDVLSSYYGSYDGVPAWLIDYFPPPTNPYPWPLDDIIFWEQGYLTQGCSESFQFIYNNTDDAIYKWANFWVKMAETFKDNSAVLGYEYMNEPWIGDYFQDGTLRLPGVAGRENLMPAYDIITEAIRQVDPDNGLVFFEPVIYGQLLSGNFTGSGMDRVPGGEQYKDQSVYSWHAYCWALEFVDLNATDEDRIDAKQFCIDELLPQFFDAAQENIQRTGGAGMLTEFGICTGNEIEEPTEMPCDTFVDLADEYLHSWTEWDYNGEWYIGGERNWEKILPHVRPYARRTAGIPQYMYFDRETLDFTFQFEADLSITAPTELFAPAARYINGFQVSVSQGFQFTTEGSIINVTPQEDNIEVTDVTVMITSL